MATKVELTLANGTKKTISQIAADMRPLLIITLKPDTALCNKQLKIVEDLLEEGVFADKCAPIGVVVGTLNEIEQWEQKMQLKYPIIQGTPDFLEMVGCCSRGKVKRACVLLGDDEKIEFVDTAVKSGVSFVPKLKEYLATVTAKPSKVVAKAKAAGKKSVVPNKSARSAQPPSAVADTPAPAEPVKLKVTRKSAAATAAAAEPAEEKKRPASVKRAQSKKRAVPGNKECATDDKSADLVSTSTPGEEEEPTTAPVASAKIKVQSAKPQRKSAAASKNKKRVDPNSDIDSPAAAEPAAAAVDAPSQSRQRKRIKIVS